MLPCVSQGATPIGPELTITAADGNVIDELAGQPALDKLRETIEALPAARARARPGRAADGDRGRRRTSPTTCRATSSCAGWSAPTRTPARSPSAADVQPGQVVRLHARDAASADRDLREALGHPHGGARRPRAGGRAACSPATAAGAGCSARPTTTPRRVAEELAGAPAAGFFAAGRDRPGRRRVLPARLHRDRRGVRLTRSRVARRVCTVSAREPRGPDRPGDRRHRRARAGDRARARGAAARTLVLTGRRADVLEPLAAETGGRALACDLADRADARPAASTRPATSTSSSPTPALPGSGRIESFTRRGDRPRARRQPARADGARAAAVRGHGRARRRPPRLRLLAVRQGGQRPARRSTRRRSSACAASRWACARTCGRAASASRPSSPASSATPACSTTSGAKLPRFVGTKTPEDVAAAVVRAIERDRAEIDVAPLAVRARRRVRRRSRPSSSATRAAPARRRASSPTQFERGQRDKR